MVQKKSTEVIEQNINESIKKLAELRQVKTGGGTNKESRTWLEVFLDENIDHISGNEIKIVTKLRRFDHTPEVEDNIYIFRFPCLLCSYKYNITKINILQTSIEINAVVVHKLENDVSMNTFLSNTMIPAEIKESLKKQINENYNNNNNEEK